APAALTPAPGGRAPPGTRQSRAGRPTAPAGALGSAAAKTRSSQNHALQVALDTRQELRRHRPIDRSVIPAQPEDRHWPDRDRVVALGIGDDDWTLDHCLEVEDRDLRLVDDRGRGNRAEPAR